jgi:hypothetical protein
MPLVRRILQERYQMFSGKLSQEIKYGLSSEMEGSKEESEVKEGRKDITEMKEIEV